MSEYNREYYRERSAQSRARAAAATRPEIAAIHLDLAERYEAIARTKPSTGEADRPRAETATWARALQVAAG